MTGDKSKPHLISWTVAFALYPNSMLRINCIQEHNCQCEVGARNWAGLSENPFKLKGLSQSGSADDLVEFLSTQLRALENGAGAGGAAGWHQG